MENQAKEETENIQPMEFNDEIKNYLYTTAKWGKMLAIVGFIGISFMVILGIFMGAGFSFMSGVNPALARMPGRGFGLALIYILTVLLQLFPTLFLYQFSNNIKQGIDYNNKAQMTEAFSRLKSLFKFYGIYILAIAIFCVLLMMIIAIGGMVFMNTLQR